MADPTPKPDAAAKAKKKSDAAEMRNRINTVLQLRLDGIQFHQLVQYASEQKWDVSERQLWTYIARADALLVERTEKSRKKALARHLAQRQDLYARTVNAADYRTALAILDSDAKLRGLFPEKEIKELVRLAATQGTRIEELERRLRDANTSATTPPTSGATGPPTGPTGGDDAGQAGGPDSGVPAGPVPTDD